MSSLTGSLRCELANAPAATKTHQGGEDRPLIMSRHSTGGNRGWCTTARHAIILGGPVPVPVPVSDTYPQSAVLQYQGSEVM